MPESPYAKMRSRVRVKTNLEAAFLIKNNEEQSIACNVIDLSQAGAGVVSPHSGKIAMGDIIVLNISVPNTILKVSVRAEIRWLRRRAKDLVFGMQFQELLSERMFQQLIQKKA
jgi:c-di-GMP-binding flagellar brake protein YcgR